MHSRLGLATAYLSKEWFDLIRASIDEAQKCGIEAWIYDEGRYPSGAAGGLVTKNPEYRRGMLRVTRRQRNDNQLLNSYFHKCSCRNSLKMKLEGLSFRDRFGILLKKRLSGVAELKYTVLYGKYRIKLDFPDRP
jgi:hypothetical protein